MKLSTVIGSSGSGKSTYIYEKILQDAMNNPQKNYLIIVPEQYTMATQRLLVAKSPNHCIMNIDILSFNRLAFRVFDELGMNTIGVLDDTGKSLVLRKLVTKHLDELSVLRKNMTRISYITQVKSLISEMTQYNITPDVLREMIEYAPMSKSFQLKATDFLVLYEAFLKFIDGRFLTTESILSKLNEVLAESKIIEDAVVVLDGFTGFTPIQYQLVESFLKLCSQVYVTITADIGESLISEHDDSDLFKMSSDFVKRLNEIAKWANAQIEEPIYIDGTTGRFANNPTLAYLEKHIFRNNTAISNKPSAQDAISLLTVKNLREELRYTAITISKYIRRGYKYRNFAVVCPNLEEYRYLVGDIFEEYGIPFFIDAKTDVLFHPFIELLEALFEMYDSSFSAESVFRLLRSGFTNLTVDEIDILENYIISTGIRGRKKYFHPFVIRSNTFCTDEQLVHVNEIREKIVKNIEAFDCVVMQKDTTVRDIAKAVYELIVAFDCEKKILERGLFHEKAQNAVKAKEYQQIYAVVMNLLDKLVEILGDEPMQLQEFSEVFKAGISQASIGVIPPAFDSVIIGDMERTRLDGIKVLFLVGASDNAIPKKIDNGGILSQLEREQLLEKFEMAPSDRQKAFRQRFYLYMMLTKPLEKLFILSPRVDKAGKGVNVSYLMEFIKDMYSDLKIIHFNEYTFEERTLSSKSTIKELIMLLKSFAQNPMQEASEDAVSRLKELISWCVEENEWDCQALIDNIFYSYKKETISDEILELVNEVQNDNGMVRGSVSKLEAYARCSYAYFLTYILKLKEREEFELSSLDMGNFYHNALDIFSKLIVQNNEKWSALSQEKLSNYIEVATKMTFERMNKVATLEDPTQRYLVQGLCETLTHTANVITEQVKRGKMEPTLFEEQIEAILYSKDEQPVAKLNGKVDRIDIDEETGSVRIVDYKSSEKKLDLDCVYHGLSLQLPIYMNAVLDKLKEKYTDIHPSAMAYYSILNPYVEGGSSLMEYNEQRLKESKLQGLVVDDTEEINENDSSIAETGKSVVVPISLTRDGTCTSNSSVLATDDMDILLKYSYQKAGELATAIMAGDFEVKPTDMVSSCEYCKFNSVCHFNENVDGFEVKKLERFGKDVCVEMDKLLNPQNYSKKGDDNNEVDE